MFALHHGLRVSSPRAAFGLRFRKCFPTNIRTKVSMALVKELRESSGAPITDCMKALSDENVNGNIEEAFVWLRRKGMAKASTMQSRSANEGVVSVIIEGSHGLIMEVNSETDFVARTTRFHDFVNDVTKAAFEVSRSYNRDSIMNLSVSDLLSADVPGKHVSVKDLLADTIGAIRENISIKRATCLSVERGGSICSYVHGSLFPGRKIGSAGALVALEYSGRRQDVGAQIEQAGKNLAMHCVAAKPLYLDKLSIPSHHLEKELEILSEQAKTTGKPQHIIEKTVEGKMNKYYSEMTLLGQSHMVEEGNPKIEEYLQTLGKQLEGSLRATSFVRFAVGENNLGVE